MTADEVLRRHVDPEDALGLQRLAGGQQLVPRPVVGRLLDAVGGEDLGVVPEAHRVEVARQVVLRAVLGGVVGLVPLDQLGVDVLVVLRQLALVALDQIVDRLAEAAAGEEALALGGDLDHVGSIAAGDLGRDGVEEGGPVVDRVGLRLELDLRVLLGEEGEEVFPDGRLICGAQVGEGNACRWPGRAPASSTSRWPVQRTPS